MRWPAHFALSGDSEPSGIYYIQGKGAGFIIKRLIIKVLINLDWPLYFQTLFIALPITGSPPQIFP
ncbi:hypothetical protein, partial [Klebsiella pasteurii]|uniref:hypothetical protein n=1 Tax=Klebsiella pasteurii TaxID=2587529 RepID=UPI00292B29E0